MSNVFETKMVLFLRELDAFAFSNDPDLLESPEGTAGNCFKKSGELTISG